MSKQDTYDKLRHGIHVGMQLEHKFRRVMLSPGHDWFCTINEINEANNELEVSITNQTGQSHPETWNMAHTINGLAIREYLEITGETE